MNKRVPLLLPFVLASWSCVHRNAGRFAVVPAAPEYRLTTPEGHETPFSDVLRSYNGYKPGLDWIDIRPGMQLHIENAFYKEGMPRSGLEGFLGTETAQYALRTHRLGLKLLAVKSMPNRPISQAPVEQLVSPAQQHHHFFRFYNEVFWRTGKHSRGSVLLGAGTKKQLAHLSAELPRNPDAVCSQNKDACTVFPEACSVAIEMEITVNNEKQTVPWTSSLASIAQEPHQLSLSRLDRGHLVPVTIPANDVDALRLPLLPGDQVTFR